MSTNTVELTLEQAFALTTLSGTQAKKVTVTQERKESAASDRQIIETRARLEGERKWHRINVDGAMRPL